VLVYGDGERLERTAEKLARLRSGLGAPAAGPGLALHAWLAGLLVEAGELAQGLLDEQLARFGEERWTPLSNLCARLTRLLAGALHAALADEALPNVGSAAAILDGLDWLALPPEITVHVPEGFAHYALYPETYLRAAAALREETGSLWVIGIRSIGTNLAALVAAGAGGAAGLLSVRPVGHPFARRLAVGEDLTQLLLSPRGARYAVVDEGPGLSGSSFGCVADWLEERGVPPESIVFFPSHRGDLGPRASGRHRQRWRRARRITTDFADLFLTPGAPLPLASAVEDLTGPAESPLEDVSGGRWRARLPIGVSCWPAVHLQQERRKFLLAAGGRRWLLKFEGLGRYGEEALARAETLAEAGLAPPVAGLRHGFLVGPWLDDARPLPIAPQPDRAALLDQVARHLAFLAKRFPVAAAGAAPERLLEMAAFNAQQALGKESAAGLSAWKESLPGLTRRARPAAIDARLHAWEWLVLPDGRILKADALDHHRGNDLVGAQDPAWDIAGAAVELGLTGEERESLREQLVREGATRATPRDLAFYEAAYLAFQLGRNTLAATALAGADASEAARLRVAAERYGRRLRALLAGGDS
jgi:hypothetical protein